MASLFLWLLAPSLTSASTLSFDHEAAATKRAYSENQFLVRGRDGDFYITESLGGFFPENGSLYLNIPGFTGPVEVSHETNLFSVTSIDLAEYSTAFASPQTCIVEGRTSDGRTITQTFVTDGKMDGSGAGQDFQTFYFGPEFADLVQLTVTSGLVALDNLAYSLGAALTPSVPPVPRINRSPVRSARQITLSWYGTKATTYLIERRLFDASTWSTVAEISASETRYTDKLLTPKTTYVYRVSARNEVGLSLPSSELPITTSAQSSFVLKNITFDPKRNGQTPPTGTDDAFSSIVFGSPRIQKDALGLFPSALVFRGRSGTYDQVQINLSGQYAAYSLLYRVATKNLQNTPINFALIVDSPEVRNLIMEGASSSFTIYHPRSPAGQVGHFEDETIYQVEIILNLVTDMWRVLIDGEPVHQGPLFAEDLSSVRLSCGTLGNAQAQPEPLVAIESFKVSVIDPDTWAPTSTATPTPSPQPSPTVPPEPPRIVVPSNFIRPAPGNRLTMEVRVVSSIPIVEFSATCGKASVTITGRNPYRLAIRPMPTRPSVLSIKARNAEGRVSTRNVIIMRPGR